MNKILNFSQFNESYLKGSRQPIYHFTNGLYLRDIFNDNILKTSQAADGKNSISFTRSLYYTMDGNISNLSIRFVLDLDKLKNDGYKIVPYDEIGSYGKGNPRLKGYSKVNYKFPGISVKHNLDIEDFEFDDGLDAMEWEYEERCFTNIKNLGKYLMAIDITKNAYRAYNEEIDEYLNKYPSIEIFELNPEKLWDRKKLIIQ